MEDISVREMLQMQRALHARYADRWSPLTPENGRDSLLWCIGEVSEAAEIIKKIGDDAIMTEAETRAHFTEELADAAMYLFDAMISYGITEKDFADAYRVKHERNLRRW